MSAGQLEAGDRHDEEGEEADASERDRVVVHDHPNDRRTRR